jgi:hypothetical protein
MSLAANHASLSRTTRLAWTIVAAGVVVAAVGLRTAGMAQGLVLLALGALLVLSIPAARARMSHGAMTSQALVGLVLVYSGVRDVTLGLPLGPNHVLELAPARLLLLGVPIAWYAAKSEWLRDPDVRRLVQAAGATQGLLIVTTLLLFPVVGLAAGSPWSVASALLLRTTELVMLAVLASFVVETTAKTKQSSEPPPAADSPPVFSSTFLTGMVLVILVAVPFSLQLDLERSSGWSRTIRLPIVDVAIWTVAALELGRIFGAAGRVADRGARKRLLKAETFGHLDLSFALLAVAGFLSLMARRGALAGWKDAIQMWDTYIVSCWLISRWLRGAPKWGALGLGLAALFTAVAGAALWQILVGTPPYLVRSLFPERSSLVAAILLLAPLAWCVLQAGGNVWLRNTTVVLVGAAAAVSGMIVTPFLVGAQLAVAGIMVGRNGLRPAAVIVMVALACWALLPRGYRETLAEEAATSIFVPMGERRWEVLIAKYFLASSIPETHFQAGPWHVFAHASLADWTRSATPPRFAEERDAGRRVLQEYYAQSWSALRLMGSQSLVGSGVGTWEERIGTGFGLLERTGTTFPNTYNGYLLLGVTIGPPGLMVWLMLLGLSIRRARSLARASEGRLPGWIGAGALAGLLGSGVAMLFCPVATLPLGVYWVLLACLARGPRAEGTTPA